MSCKKIVLGEDEIDSPENNFELLWNDLDQHYSLFEVRNINWDSLYTVYKPRVSNQASSEPLWLIFTELLEHLDDSHTSINTENDETFFISGYAKNNQSKKEYSKNLITDSYLESRTEIETEDNLSYGKIKNKDIGYIYFGASDGSNPAIIDEILENLKTHKAIIFDIRQNTGGDDYYAARIAGAFADKEKVIYSAQTRNGPKHSDFDEKTFHSTKKEGPEQFLKPVILITDRRTISAGEVFSLHMKAFDHVVQIGDTTAGDFSAVSNRNFLPNGWSYKYSVQKLLLPNGKSLDGIGHSPDIYIKNNESDINTGTDKVLEKAFAYLFEEFGID